MKFLAIAALASVATAVNVGITFHGARGESYTASIPTDRTNVQFDNPMVVYSVSSTNGGFCNIVGVDGETVVLYSATEKTLKKPQAMKSGNCGTI
ncbi:uncharacterized protein KD926_011254 [Aspergillus affinis]|uniref:uncharacterized protein n=1 Tax=Aspergillus affinis TaxID=1070780 RepID=UPI0022FE631D|nr:uncharacterized protein KD926_011254 [Aspergillus affinis]KAI9038120.1 hypothetical protein KD926_011254 [Aspergillus affinis]